MRLIKTMNIFPMPLSRLRVARAAPLPYKRLQQNGTGRDQLVAGRAPYVEIRHRMSAAGLYNGNNDSEGISDARSDHRLLARHPGAGDHRERAACI
jgi:hypothetical protein